MKRISTILLLALLILVGITNASNAQVKTFPYAYSWSTPAQFALQSDFNTYIGGDGNWRTYNLYGNVGQYGPHQAEWRAENGRAVTEPGWAGGRTLELWVDATGLTLTGGETFSCIASTDVSGNIGTMSLTAGSNSVVVSIASIPITPSVGSYSITIPAALSNSVFPIQIIVNITSNGGYVFINNATISGGVLPVQLFAFIIKDAKKNTVELDWTTISEKNNYGFYVQKSADGKDNFAILGFVPGYGTSLSTHMYSFTDNSAPFTFYRLQQVDLNGSIQYSNTISPAMTGPAAMSTPRLNQNYPNPFNPSTQIVFSVTKEGPVSLRVYDILGRAVATLANENRKAGEYTERFDGSRLASGVYMYVLQSGDSRLTSRMILSK